MIRTKLSVNEYYKLKPIEKMVGLIKDNPQHKCFKCKVFWDNFHEHVNLKEQGEWVRDAINKVYVVGDNYCNVLNFKLHPESIELKPINTDIWFADFNVKSYTNFCVTECSEFIEYKENEIYYAYLKSEEWRTKKMDVLKRDGFRCVNCGTAKNLEVHHTTYNNLLNEDISELVTLCDYCHENVHKIDLYKKSLPMREAWEKQKQECDLTDDELLELRRGFKL